MVDRQWLKLLLSAVFADNDSVSAGASETLKENVIAVPLKLFVVGFNDIPISRYTEPQRSTVRYPIVSMAKLATELALKGAAGQLDHSAQHCYMPTLVRRHSVALRQSVSAVTNSGDLLV